MNKLVLILLIVVIAYVAYTAYPSFTGNIVSKTLDSEKEDFVESDAAAPNSDLTDVSEPKHNLESQKLQLANITENKTSKDLCEKIVCQNSSKTCPDGFLSTCKNSCSNNLCSACIPNCEGHEIQNQNSTCIEIWSCSDWLVCANGEQTRICTDQNNCEAQKSKPIERQTCILEQEQLTVLVSTQNQTIVRGSDVEISVKVLYNLNPVENANVFINLTYASGTVVSNTSLTNSTGDYLWVKKIGGNSKTGTFQISAEASKEGYTSGLGQASFEVIAKS